LILSQLSLAVVSDRFSKPPVNMEKLPRKFLPLEAGAVILIALPNQLKMQEH
jgi:hypothetical protein